MEMFLSGEFGFVGDGKFHERIEAAQFEFLADVGAMVFDRAHADE